MGMDDDPPPTRPPGQPKPLLDEDIASVLARLDAWYAKHLPPDEYVFNPPATDDQIDQIEKLVGFKLPASYRQLYHWHDGDDISRYDHLGHIYGLPILPLDQVAMEWKTWNLDVLREFEGNRYMIPGASWPPGDVDPAYINPRWIPLTADGSGNSIGIDFDPWPGGRVGQVILFGRDEDMKVALAESLGKFLEWIAGLLESGNFRLDDDGKQRLRQFRLKSPESYGFHDGARKLLGAPGPTV